MMTVLLVAAVVLAVHLGGIAAAAGTLRLLHGWDWAPALLVGCAWPVILPLAVWEWVGGRRI